MKVNMNKTKLTEGLDWHDLEGQLSPIVSVDEYAANMGKDCDIVTLAFTIRSEHAGEDLANWFEKGYAWVLDAQVSEGEVTPGKHLVFVELERRSTVPSRIIELLGELTTLTNLQVSDWTVRVEDDEYAPDETELAAVITTSPHVYREREEALAIDKEEGLNEMRVSAGLPVKAIYKADDAAMRAFKALAGL